MLSTLRQTFDKYSSMFFTKEASDTKNDMETNLNWKMVRAVSKNQRKLQENDHDSGRAFLQASYYIDVNGKEWIVLPVREHQNEKDSLNEARYDVQLYDVENDKLVPLIAKFMHSRWPSYVIDNKNHVLYWVANNYDSLAEAWLGFFIAYDIKDLQNVQVMYQQKISNSEFPNFACGRYKMLMVGNTIQFVLRHGYLGAWDHYEYNIKTRKLKLTHENIFSRYVNHVSRSNVVNLFENLKVGDWIDTRDFCGYWYFVKVLEIKDNYSYNYDDNNDNEKQVLSRKIKVEFQGGDTTYEHWITVEKYITLTDEQKQDSDFTLHLNDKLLTSLCDCQKECYFSGNHNIKFKDKEKYKQFHQIALPRCQSLHMKYSTLLNAVYSKSHKKLIVIGRNRAEHFLTQLRDWGGLIYKYINYDQDYKDYPLIVDGFIHRVQHSGSINNIFINIPEDLNQMILKYYYIPNDDEWTQVVKTDENGTYVRDMFDGDNFPFPGGCCCVVANNGDDIFMFGGTRKGKASSDILKLNITTNTLRRLDDVKCPLSSEKNWKSITYAVFCEKSNNIHLFAKNFSEHVSIPLQKLNDSSSVLLDE